MRFAGLALFATLALASCGQDAAPTADATPIPSDAAAGPFVPGAPGSPGAPADSSPAARALSAAAQKTSESGAFRVKLSASFAGAATGPRGAMDGTGEAENHARFHLSLMFNSGTQQFSTESTSFDGTNYGRSNTKPWHVVSGAGSSGDPRSYLGYLTGATAVRDAGPGVQAGQPAERYEAVVPIKRTAAPGAPATSATLGQMVAWVDLASGRLVVEELTTNAGTPRETRLNITFSDFGADIKVVPPVLTP